MMKDSMETRIPWYLSVWFIIIVSILTFWLFWIPGIVLGIIRFFKYKEKRRSSVTLILFLGIPCAMLIFISASVTISTFKTEKQLNAYIESGQYAEAQELIKQEYGVGTLSFTEKMAGLYELQGMYDEAVNLWIEYCNNNYKPIDIPDFRIEELNGYIEKHEAELQSETVMKIRKLIDDREQAKAEEQAAKEAKEAEEKAAKEAKEAEEKAAREAKEAEEKAAREAKEAEKKAAKEAKEAEEKAAKEAKEAEERAAKEAKEAEQKQKKEDVENVQSEIKETPDFETLDAFPDNKKYLHLGGSYKSKNGKIEMDIIDINTRIFELNGLVTTNIYIIADITNNGDTDVYFDQSCAVLFINDYEADKGAGAVAAAENGYSFDGNNVSYPTAINVKGGGRKGMILFTASLDNKSVNEDSEIDFEINGGIFKINPLFILNADKIGKPEGDPKFEGTELEGYVVQEVSDGSYQSADTGVSFAITNNKVIVQFSDGHDFAFEDLVDNGDGTYTVVHGEDVHTLQFLGDGTKVETLYVEGPLGGLYDK